MVAQMELMTYADRKPMGRQLSTVYALMSFGDWWTFESLRDALLRRGIGISEAGVSARIRDLRKPCYGQHIIERRKTERKGIWSYRMVPR